MILLVELIRHEHEINQYSLWLEIFYVLLKHIYIHSFMDLYGLQIFVGNEDTSYEIHIFWWYENYQPMF